MRLPVARYKALASAIAAYIYRTLTAKTENEFVRYGKFEFFNAISRQNDDTLRCGATTKKPESSVSY